MPLPHQGPHEFSPLQEFSEIWCLKEGKCTNIRPLSQGETLGVFCTTSKELQLSVGLRVPNGFRHITTFFGVIEFLTLRAVTKTELWTVLDIIAAFPRSDLEAVAPSCFCITEKARTMLPVAVLSKFLQQFYQCWKQGHEREPLPKAISMTSMEPHGLAFREAYIDACMDWRFLPTKDLFGKYLPRVYTERYRNTRTHMEAHEAVLAICFHAGNKNALTRRFLDLFYEFGIRMTPPSPFSTSFLLRLRRSLQQYLDLDFDMRRHVEDFVTKSIAAHDTNALEEQRYPCSLPSQHVSSPSDSPHKGNFVTAMQALTQKPMKMPQRQHVPPSTVPVVPKRLRDLPEPTRRSTRIAKVYHERPVDYRDDFPLKRQRVTVFTTPVDDP